MTVPLASPHLLTCFPGLNQLFKVIFAQPGIVAVQHFLLIKVRGCFVQRFNITDIIFVTQTVPQDNPEGLQGSLDTISDRTRANLILDSVTDTDLSTALDQANKALEAAQKVGQEAEVEALCTVFKVHLLKRDFYEARKRLSDARKLKVGDMKRFIDNNLKIMIVIDKCLDDIHRDEGITSHCQFEKIADSLIKYESSGEERNKVLEISIEYYKKAYERASKEGSTEQFHRQDIWRHAGPCQSLGVL